MRGDRNGPGDGGVVAVVIITSGKTHSVNLVDAGGDAFVVCSVPEGWSGAVITSKRFGNVWNLEGLDSHTYQV